MTLGGLRTWVHGSGRELQGQIEIVVPGKSTGSGAEPRFTPYWL